MCFPKAISKNNFFNYTLFFILLTFNYFHSGCSVTKIYHEIPPSPDAIQGINSIYVDEFNGNRSVLFEKILNHEIRKHDFFKNLQIFPDLNNENSALLKAEVTRYLVKDVQEIRKQKQILLIEKEVPKNNSLMMSKSNRIFDFVEKFYDERIIHRTLDIEFSFKITNAAKDKILHLIKENASLKLSYVGEENILLMPDANDEMARLSQLLIRKFLDKINPKTKTFVIELEKGTDPVSWTFGLVDFGHPRIIRSNHFAVGQRYKLAIKGWNYVLFEPRTFPESENFVFSDDVFLRLKKADIPKKILKTLFTIRGKSFDKKDINVVLLGLISNQNFERYSKIIKYHARFDQKIDRINLASAHYNLASVYQLLNEFDLAAYHYSRANAFNPQEKYSQSWVEVQHLMGNYNPQNDLFDMSIKSFGDKPPPESALLRPMK